MSHDGGVDLLFIVLIAVKHDTAPCLQVHDAIFMDHRSKCNAATYEIFSILALFNI